MKKWHWAMIIGGTSVLLITLVFSVITMITFWSALGGDNDPVSAGNTEEREAVAEPKEDISEEEDDEPLEDIADVSADLEVDTSANAREEEVIKVLKGSYDSAEVTFDSGSKTFKITPHDEELSESLLRLKTGQVPDDGSWDYMIESIVELSAEISDFLEDHYTILLINPRNDNDVLMGATGGILIYDMMED